MALHIDTIDFYLAAAGPQHRRQHPDGGRLAGAVGSEEGEDLALRHIKTDIVHGGEVAKRLGQCLCADHAAS
jgi:hypothetical protein